MSGSETEINIQNELVVEILDTQGDQNPVDYLVDNLFKTHKIDKIEEILHNVKKNLFQKNDCLREYLSQNQNQLLSCGDLIETLQKYSNTSIENTEKLSEYIQQINEMTTFEDLQNSELFSNQTNMLKDNKLKTHLFIEMKSKLFTKEILIIQKKVTLKPGYFLAGQVLLKNYLKNVDDLDYETYAYNIIEYLQENLNNQLSVIYKMLGSQLKFSESIFHEFNLSCCLIRSIKQIVWVDLIANLKFLQSNSDDEDVCFNLQNDYIIDSLTQDELVLMENEGISQSQMNIELMILWYTIIQSFYDNSSSKIDLIDLIKTLLCFADLNKKTYDHDSFQAFDDDFLIKIFTSYTFQTDLQNNSELLIEAVLAEKCRRFNFSTDSNTIDFLQNLESENGIEKLSSYLNGLMEELYTEKFSSITTRFFITHTKDNKIFFDFSQIEKFQKHREVIERFEEKFGKFQNGIEQFLLTQWKDYYNTFFSEISNQIDQQYIYESLVKDISVSNFLEKNHDFGEVLISLEIGINKFLTELNSLNERLVSILNNNLSQNELLENSMNEKEIKIKLYDEVLEKLQNFDQFITKNIEELQSNESNQTNEKTVLLQIFTLFLLFDKYCQEINGDGNINLYTFCNSICNKKDFEKFSEKSEKILSKIKDCQYKYMNINTSYTGALEYLIYSFEKINTDLAISANFTKGKNPNFIRFLFMCQNEIFYTQKSHPKTGHDTLKQLISLENLIGFAIKDSPDFNRYFLKGFEYSSFEIPKKSEPQNKHARYFVGNIKQYFPNTVENFCLIQSKTNFIKNAEKKSPVSLNICGQEQKNTSWDLRGDSKISEESFFSEF